MKKKVFSLMMMLLLAFMGVAKAEVVTIGDGTGTTYYAPFNSLWGYSFVEQVYTASEIGTAGTINAISFNMQSTDSQTNQVDVFMKNVTRTNFSGNTDWEPVTASDMVFSGTVTFNNGWTTITLNTPFQYDGTSNLMIGMHEYTSGYSTRYFYYTSVTGGLISGHSDSANPDPYNMGSFSGTTYVQNYRANIQIDITAGGGGGETVEVTIGDPTSTTSSSYLPTYSLYEYSLTQQIYTADEIGVGGTINSLTMWLQNTSSYARNLNFYLKEANVSAFAGGDWVSMSSSDLVGSITLANGISSFTETTINLSTPFEYTGNGNLVLCVQDVTGSWSSGAYGNTLAASGNQAIYAYRDGTVFDPTTPGVTGYTLTSKNVLRMSITTEGGGGGGFEDKLHVKYMDGEEEIIDTLNMGVRPANAWMEPFNFTMYSEGPNYTVTVLDFTPSDGMFSVEGEELPFHVAPNADVELTLACNGTEAGVIERQFVAITEGDRAAHVWPIVVEMYEPAIPDVWEKACTEATTFPFVEVPATAHNTTLHNDYDLPFDEIEEGYDAVYKLVFANDMVLNAEVSNGENGKVALYTEDFYGEGGPMATNNYNGPMAAGGSAATPFEVQIGEGTTTTTYFPFYTFYNYCIAENLFLAAELAEAGVTTAPMTSLSWYATNAPGYNQQGITIWMANVEDEALTTTSHIVTGMTKVYTGAMTPAIGWNEFVFNEGTFSWDGHSNVLIYCQRNNGVYNSSVSWQATGSLPFNAMSYRYQDSGAYDPTIANTMYTSTTRPNVIMKAEGRRNRDLVDFEDGTMPAGWQASSIGAGWEVATSSDYGSIYPYNGNYAIYSNGDGNYEYDYFVSPAVTINGAGSLSFAWCTPTWAGDQNDLSVGYGTTANGPWTWLMDSQMSNSWTTANYDLSSLNGTYYICFRSYDGYGYCTAIDDININVPTTPAPVPTDEISYGPVITNAPVAAGTYYLVASSTDEDFEVTINAQAMPCPTVDGFAFNPMPADNEDEIEPASVTLQWMNPANATEYQVVFGSTYHPEANHPQTVISDWTPVTSPTGSFTVRNLWNNTNYFWHVVFRNNGACTEGVSSPIWGFTTHLNIPQNLRANDETIFNDETVTLTWNAVQDRTFRTYFIYRDGVKIGETTMNNIGNATYTDGPLEYNMEGYTYYVTAVYDEGESAPSNTVNVKVSGYGNVNGHVYEQDGTTGIANATVTMVGQDEFGVSHTYNFQTNTQGYYTGHIYAGAAYDGQAAKDGYQTAYEPVQGEPIVIVYDQTTSPIDYILDENFDPVCQVIAEYYPDSLDPNSPYVKVYWGCGLPGSEIIEDFETGDFSMFDWQVDPAYPWTVTTTNPYEGTYCMKSGGAGVPSVVSDMTVTVDIPADGIMSYYGKISCESNWDYGYFYIDGVQKAQYTGVSNWAEKHFDITAGTHTFKWSYTKDASVNSNDDCFYVDYICFYKQPEPPQPAQPGWHTYAEGDFNNAVGSNVGTSRWAYEYPVSVLGGYAGFNMTKVSLFSDTQYSAVGGNYTCTIYQGGNEPMEGTAVSTITVDVPSNQNAWVDFDLTNPVSITGSDKLWVVWTANSTVSSWPAGCTDVSLIEEGTWWSAGIEAGYGWEHQTYGTWTMRQYFTNRAGEGFYSYASENAPVAVEAPVVAKGAPVMPEKGKEIVTTVCADPTPAPVARYANGNRSLNHYRVYRTNCYQECPFTEENTVLLATVWVPDTVYIDVEWADLEPGVYKWGVGAVYVGNRGEMIEGPITWTAPQAVNRVSGSFAAKNGTTAGSHTENAGISNRDGWLIYDDGVNVDAIGLTAGGSFYWGVMFPGGSYEGNMLTKVSMYDYSAHTGNILIYQGGDTAPGTLVGTEAYTCTGSEDFAEWTLSTPVAIDPTQNLWIVMNNTNGQYVAPIADYCGDDNSQWLSIDGISWDGLYNATGGALDGTWMIRAYVEENGGNTPGSDNCNQLALPRESETIWSNCLDKDMFIIGESQDGVTVNVLLNSADSPEGVQVTFTNYNEAEQEMYPVDPITLDETGFYAFESFRKGEYNVKVEFDGYEPIEDSVSIWEPTDLRYVMTEIIYGVSDLYVSSTGWAMWGAEGMPTPGGGGGGGGQGSTFSVDLEGNSLPEGWTVIDGNNDGWTWCLTSAIPTTWTYYASLTLDWYHSGTNAICSGSYINGVGALNPDEYLVTPQVTLGAGSTFSFWAAATDASYAADHFGVFVSDDMTNWTSVQEWTLTAKNAAKSGDLRASRDGNGNRLGNWYNYSVDLSAYAGQKYIAIRHFNCYDQYIMCVDDIELTDGAKDGDRHLEYFKVMCTSIDGEPIFNADTENPFCQVNTESLVAGDHYIAKVAAVYSTGMSAWSECEWQYIPCDNYAGTVNGVEVNGNEISWEYPGGGPGPQPGQGDAFSVDFEAGLPAGWNVVDGNNDGYTWCLTSNIPSTWTYYAGMSLDWYHNGTNAICSGSYINGVGALNPDEYLVTPQVNIANGSTFSFYAAATDASYAADHFGVFVSDDATNWTSVQEWTLTGKSAGKAGDIRASRDGRGLRIGNWYSYSVDLSAYAGQKYIAIRHFNCYDQYIMCVDDIELTNGAKNSRAAWDLMMTFTAPEGGHYGVAYDGNNFYTSNWGYSGCAHNFYKYDLQGNMLEGFEIAGCGTLRGITYDGQYFYGVANSATVYCVDLAAHNVVSTFSSAYGAMRGITYDPVRDGFWVIGNWSGNLTLIDRTGAIQQVGPAPESASDLAYYMDENNVEHVFCFNNGTNDVVDYNITTNTLGGSVFNFSAIPGFDAGTSGGCTVGSFNNKIAFIGDIQQSPNLIGVYELRDDTNPGPGPGPQPGGDILGAMIFADGEWVDFVQAPTNTYTYEGEAEQVCVRIVYNGTNNLPEGNIYFSMSCPECVEFTPAGCAPGEPIHAEVDNTYDEVTVWWGEQPTPPAQPIEEWLYYDDGANVDAIGLTNGGSFYWGIKFPAASLSQYVDCSVTKIAYFDYTAHTGTVRIYNGSNGNAPGTLIGTYNYTANGTEDWAEWTIPAVAFDNTQDLWIVMNNASGQYVASLGNYTGDPNGTMISTDGSTWYTLSDATGGQLTGTWNLRCFVSNQAKGEVAVLDEKGNGTPNGVFANAGVAKVGGTAPMNPVRATMVQYNVYRSTDNETYEMIGSVPYVEGQTYYEYVDAPGAGNYYYQVRALYDNDCESEPAPAFDDPTHDYVTASVDAVNENSDNVALYPNPTKGNVTIEAAGMSRITVVSVLGQVVYDTEVSEDTYVMNMSQFTAGMYMVRVYTESGVTVKRVTVMQ